MCECICRVNLDMIMISQIFSLEEAWKIKNIVSRRIQMT